MAKTIRSIYKMRLFMDAIFLYLSALRLHYIRNSRNMSLTDLSLLINFAY